MDDSNEKEVNNNEITECPSVKKSDLSIKTQKPRRLPEGPSDIFKMLRNCTPVAAPPFRATSQFIRFLHANHEERRRLLKSSARIVHNHHDAHVYQRELIRVHRRIAADPELADRWVRGGRVAFSHISPNPVRRRTSRVLGQRVALQFHPKDPLSINKKEVVRVPTCFDDAFIASQHYVAPKTRILITPNLTGNALDPIPVYSDIRGETLENLKIPDSLLYQYVDRNVVNADTEPDLQKAVEFAENPQNTISCKCSSLEDGDGRVINCFENPDCPCFQMNHRLKSLQSVSYDADNKPRTPAVFSSFQPILFNSAGGVYFEYVGFACSDLCSCRGHCTNNAMFLVNKRVVPFELYRNDARVGFGLRSPILIPAGTPLMEFTGNLVECVDNDDYAYKLTYTDDVAWMRVIREMRFTDDYKEHLLKMAHEKDFFVDPKWVGNIARTVCHSCSANVEIVRIFQASLSPAHCRLLLVALEDIYPGVPITIDYGHDYVEAQLKDICKCNSFACHAGKNYASYKKMDFLSISGCIGQMSLAKYKKWEREVRTPAHLLDGNAVAPPKID